MDRIVASGADVERINAPLAALVLEVPGHYSTESRPVFMVP
ncbi:MAG: hypothetical protein VKM17_08270 [Cyanobacteriota bacterium]|nr:hypothetical protein [Cyanobacteriota bacterium]